MEVVIGLCRHDSSWDRYLIRVKYVARLLACMTITSLTPLITPQGARPAPACAYHISEVHPKNWPEFLKTMESGLQHPALHPGPPQRQDTWLQNVWCRLWNPVSGMPCAVCQWNCPYPGDKDERPPKTEVSRNSCGRPWTSHQNGQCQSDSPRGQHVATQDLWVHRNQDPPPSHQPWPGIWASPHLWWTAVMWPRRINLIHLMKRPWWSRKLATLQHIWLW